MPVPFSDKEQILALLRQSPLFAPLSEPVLVDMLGHFRRETWKRGRCASGPQSDQRFHVILAGRLKMGRVNPETGRMIALFLLKPGDVFDVISLLDGRPHQVTLEAVDDMELLSAPVDEVRRWIERHPEFNQGFLPYLGEQMRRLADLAGDLALHDTETRLARLILRHVEGGEGGNRLRLIHDLSHEALGEMIGTVRVVVNRQLQHWQKEGVILSRRGRLEIREIEVLLKKAMHFLERGGKQRRNRRENL